MNELSHTNAEGKARMVDVTHKQVVHRSATASGFIQLAAETSKLIRENQNKKGDVLTVAEIAGIQAAKQTSSLIPLCHPLNLTKVEVSCKLQPEGVLVTTSVKCTGETGVEMEALTAASVALLTIYDMCKAVDKKMIIKDIELINKTKSPLAQHP